MDRPPPPPRSPKPYHLRSSRKQCTAFPLHQSFHLLLDLAIFKALLIPLPHIFNPYKKWLTPAPTLGQLAALIATLRDDLIRVNADLEASRIREDAMAVTIAQLRDRTANTVQGERHYC